MAISRFQRLIALIVASIVLTSIEPALAAPDTSAAINAITKHYCRTAGGDRPERPPSVLYVFIRTEGDRSYAWVEGLVPGPRALRLASFYFIASKNGKSAVGYTLGYNTEFSEQNPDYQEKRNLVFNDRSRHGFSGDLQVGELHVPVKCPLPFEADTPLKLRMVGVIQKSVENWLLWNTKYLGAHYPERLTLLIANFDTDSPDTTVVVRQTGQVLGVTLHDPTDPLGDSLLERGEYHVVEDSYAPEVMSQVRRYVIANGIERKIRVGK